jgi:pSer/pThr/pTyr-binding forkhead associated (FHA) protein
MTYHYLEVIKGNPRGKRWPLVEGATSIGRNPDNNIILDPNEKSVSGHHLIIYKTATRLFMQDLGSTNGTFLNEEKTVESDIIAGDIVGFGKTGPRMKVIESQTEIAAPDEPRPAMTVAPPDTPTIEDPRTMLSRKARESRGDHGIRFADPLADDPFETPSKTMEMEKKLLNKDMGSSDLHKLLKDGKRVEKIIERGNISNTQSHLLKASYKAGRKSSRQALIVLVAVVFVSVAVIAFFSIRAAQYQAMLKNGLTMENALDKIENAMADARQAPEANRERLKQLFAQYEQTQEKLTEVKSRISTNDMGKFYADPLERTMDEIISRFGQSDYHIPPQMTERVKYHIDVFSGKLHQVIVHYLQRREQYYPMIARVFKEKKLPESLGYVSMLESGFSPMALSPVGARGLWQFMVATGQRYGLTVNDMVDERTDPEKATYAAAEYFKDLIGIFGGTSSVMLAMAAYNAGEGRVMGALKKIDDPLRDRDFWYLYRMGYLPEETKEYIPRIIALIIISEHPQQYGFAPGTIVAAEPAPTETSFMRLEDLEQ